MYLLPLAVDAPSPSHDAAASAPQLPPIATVPGLPPILQRPMPRRERSVLHAAETYAFMHQPRNALGWFLAAGVPFPRDWLLGIVAVPYRRHEPSEYYGHAIRAALRAHDTDGLREIAHHASRIDRRIARLAYDLADGKRDALREVVRMMRTIRIELEWTRVVDVPAPAEFDAAPPAIPAACAAARVNDVIASSRDQSPGTALQLLLQARCAYPLIYAGSTFLESERFQPRHAWRHQESETTWAWRYFEAAEHLRDTGTARDT